MTHSSLLPRQQLPQPSHAKPYYTLYWRQQKLFVQPSTQTSRVVLPVLQHPEWAAECLRRSSVKLVALSLDLTEKQLRFWADTCHSAQKPAYLQLRSHINLPQKRLPLYWQFKRVADWVAALLLVVALSPIFLLLTALVAVTSPGPIFFQQWRVGERGRLFRVIKFRTMVADAEHLHHQVMGNQKGLHKLKDDPRVTPIGRWMRKYSLDELPQLLNVLRGEMSLVGPRPWALYDAVRISPELQHRLNALPGITGAWQVQSRSHVRDLNLVNRCDLNYLTSWSIGSDLKFLLLTIPKVITGFGAY